MTPIWKRALASLALAAALPLAPLQAAEAGSPRDGATWLNHAQRDLLPHWLHPDALGQPHGRFPTFRCDDGRRYDASAPCAELAGAPAWIVPALGRHYVRMQSRQAFAYAVGFQLTGDPKLLDHAAAGVADIRRRALDRVTGSAVTYFDASGAAHPPVGERTTQDLAYAGLALAAYYNVTQDPATLRDLDRLHRHLMSHFDVERGEMRWTLHGPERDKRELVAQLDPLNAYLVLVTPLLHGSQRVRWEGDMARLVKAIRTHYCTGDAPRCVGTLDEGGDRPGARHNDHGHSGKAFWMVMLAARHLKDTEAEAWARAKAEGVLDEAYQDDNGSWASRWQAEGQDLGKEWWVYAELDQLAATLAVADARQVPRLERTQAFWLAHFTDPVRGEVAGRLSPSGDRQPGLLQHHWKNGYHSLEHALIGYLAAQAIAGQPATLYYDLPRGHRAALRPYLLPGQEVRRAIRRRDGRRVVEVTFALPSAR